MKRGTKPFEPAFPKLTDPLLRDTISRPEAFERRWWVQHLRGNDDRTFPVGQRGKHLDKHAPKRFRLEAFNRCGFVEAVRVDQQSDALFAPVPPPVSETPRCTMRQLVAPPQDPA